MAQCDVSSAVCLNRSLSRVKLFLDDSSFNHGLFFQSQNRQLNPVSILKLDDCTNKDSVDPTFQTMNLIFLSRLTSIETSPMLPEI